MEQTSKVAEKTIIGLDIYAEVVQISSCGQNRVIVLLTIPTHEDLEKYILNLYTKIIEDEYGIKTLNYVYKCNSIIIEGIIVNKDKIIGATHSVVSGSYRVLPPSVSIGNITSKDIDNHICIDANISENDLGLSIRTEEDGIISFYIPECDRDKSIRIINNSTYKINTGLRLRIPKDYILQIFIDHIMAIQYGITIPGGSIYYTPIDKDRELVIPIIWDGNPRDYELDWHGRLKFYPSNTVIARGVLLKYKNADIIKL